MLELRLRYQWLFAGIVALALVVIVAAPLQCLQMLWTAALGGNGPAAIARYDLRPFPGLGPEWQVVVWKAVALGWLMATGLAGFVLFAAWRTPGHRAAVNCDPPRLRPGIWLAAAGVAVGLAALLGTTQARHLTYGTKPIGSLGGLSAMLRLQLPTDAVLVEARGYSGWKGLARACLRMSHASARGFLELPVFNQGISGSLRPRWFPDELQSMAGWNPQDAESFLTASGSEYRSGDIITLTALAGLDDPGVALVYLEWVRG